MEKKEKSQLIQIVKNRISGYMNSDEGKNLISEAVKKELAKQKNKEPSKPKMEAKTVASKVEKRITK